MNGNAGSSTCRSRSSEMDIMRTMSYCENQMSLSYLLKKGPIEAVASTGPKVPRFLGHSV